MAASSGAERVKDMYRQALKDDDRDRADLISAVSKALNGPELSPMDASGSGADMSDDTLYSEASKRMGLGQGEAAQPTEDEELESVMVSLGRRG